MTNIIAKCCYKEYSTYSINVPTFTIYKRCLRTCNYSTKLVTGRPAVCNNCKKKEKKRGE